MAAFYYVNSYGPIYELKLKLTKLENIRDAIPDEEERKAIGKEISRIRAEIAKKNE